MCIERPLSDPSSVCLVASACLCSAAESAGRGEQVAKDYLGLSAQPEKPLYRFALVGCLAGYFSQWSRDAQWFIFLPIMFISEKFS